jgi:hypothetical protein
MDRFSDGRDFHRRSRPAAPVSGDGLDLDRLRTSLKRKNMSTYAIDRRSPEASIQLKARIAGGLYLIVIVGGIFAELIVRGRLVVHGDAAATARNILAHEFLYRSGFAVELFYLLCNVPLIVIFYELFKVVNKNVALLDAIAALASTAIEGVSLLAHYAPLIILKGDHLAAFSVEQRQAMAYASLDFFEYGFAICLAFFSISCFAMGYLIYKSRLIPRIIGVLLVIEGGLYFLNSYSMFLAPSFAPRVFPFLAASAIAEVSLCLWLLVMGINVRRWNEWAGRSNLATS